MIRKGRLILGVLGLLIFISGAVWYGPLTSAGSRQVGGMITNLINRAQSDQSLLTGSFRITGGEGIPEELTGALINLKHQAPDRLRLSVKLKGETYTVGRKGNSLWIHVPHKQVAIEGSNDIPRFSQYPDSTQSVLLKPIELPVKKWQLALLPALIVATEEKPGAFRCQPSRLGREKAGLPHFVLDIDIDIDRKRRVPKRLTWTRDKTKVTLEVGTLSVVQGSEESWEIPLRQGEEPELVALSHLKRFFDVTLSNLGSKIESLPPLSGERTLLATHGKGRLESIEGTKVLYLKGSPEEMGEQHGVLMKEDVRNLIDRIVYGVGIGSTFDKGRWFFGEIEEAQSRLEPFIDDRYLREMDALAAAAEVHPQEARLSNFFPELFHCSGFALHGNATEGGRMFHGRVLDYLRGLGLEQNAVVIVVQPDEGNAWVNVGYAGFVGTVTAMNEKHIAIGEMGGRGEGNWDGKPMAQLMREVMERADTIDEAVAIMKKGPRTCEYYYVISDAKSMKSVGIKATPDLFETIWSGESHPQLPDPVEDAVLMSGGDRYKELVKRVKSNYGKFDAISARDLMTRPVCMNSNIQSVLFAPDTLDFWVANADSKNVASATRYTRYNLRELLDGAAGSSEQTSSDSPSRVHALTQPARFGK